MGVMQRPCGPIFRPSVDPAAQRGLHGGAGLECPEYPNGSDGFTRQLRRYIRCDDGETEHLDVKSLALCPDSLEIGAAVAPQTEIELLTGSGLLDLVAMPVELIANGRPDEVRARGVKSLLHEQVDVAQIDEPEIDRNLLGLGLLWPQLLNISRHEPSLYHPQGWIWEAKRLFQELNDSCWHACFGRHPAQGADAAE